MDQLWVVQPAVMGYRAVHGKKMAYIAARHRDCKKIECTPALSSDHRRCSDQPQPDIR